ncbi:piwi-like protein 1 [Mytilus edulis]|uniref:piwi-like protein 1 n=1 Tax=Mytilus edulis TaxID=6550 RepID=UPI0039F1113A
MATGGFGRGGRGAALLQALKDGTRKPGDQDEKPVGVQQATQPPPIAMGRGDILRGLVAARSAPPPTPGGAPDQAPIGLARGRGLAAMQALLQGRGRSMPLPQQAQQLPVGQASPQQTQQSPGAQASPQKQHPPAGQQPSPPRAGPGSAGQPSPGQPSPGQSSTQQLEGRFARMATEDRRPTVSNVGKDGKAVALSGNYIRIKCANPGVYQYHVDYRPMVDSKNMRFKMLNEHRDVIGQVKAFDGSILYLPIRLPDQETVVISKRITDGVDITLTIRLTRVVPPESCLMVYNIIFRRIMYILQMVQVGRYFYNPKTPSAVPQHKLEVWPGYITSVCENEGGLMLLADASHRVLRTQTVLELMQQIVQRNSSGFQDECVKKLVGTVVLTRYNNKTYRIDDIIWDKSPAHSFPCKNTGESITFQEYYKKAYNKNIQDDQQPLLLHRQKKKRTPQGMEQQCENICLIPELCYMTGLTDELRSDFRVMKDIATHTRVSPAQRKLTMGKFVNSVNSSPEASQELANWGLSFDNDTIDIEGRQVQEEKIIFRDGHVMAGPQADWGRDATRKTVITAVDLKNWIVLYTKRDSAAVQEYISMMLKCCPQMGIQCNNPTRYELRDDRTETYIKSLRDNINPTVQMVVIIFPTSRDDRYSAVKKLCCVECPVPSQVIIAKTIKDQKKLRSVTQKVGLQINVKLGGELWALSIPMSNLMVVGIDVYHDATRGKRSIAGFVSSTNKECTRWYSRVCFQLPGQELIDGLKICMTSAIRKYHEVNHTFPEKVVVFRDGVGDGQLSIVGGHEVEQLKQCFRQFGDNYNPTMTVVVVQKRINARIFLKTNRDLENPPPGTVVDHTITRREWYDFYLVSQHVRQGTVSPTHYIVVHDSSNMRPDHLQRLSYKMTHLYYNWPGTVRVPAPCQYAHKLAYLVGQNIHKEPSTELSDRLFFL